jgi:DNA processing protein
MPSPETWQKVLLAEVQDPRRREELVKAVLSTPSFFESPQAASLLTKSELDKVSRFDLAVVEKGVRGGVQFIERDEFPASLASLDFPPAVLTAVGDTGALRQPTVAIVGTRGASGYGKAVATKFAEGLASHRITIVSGGALGIDSASHRGALNVGGRTVAVMSGGLDNLYPTINRSLFENIRQSGAWVSGYALGISAGNAGRLIERNSLIAALSHAVLIVEAPLDSGSIHTANAAAELGRPVYVVPANIDQFSFAGSHNLIRNGGTLVTHPAQILEELNIQADEGLGPSLEHLSREEQAVYEALSATPIPETKIAELTGFPAEEIMVHLTMLELEGLVLRDHGGVRRKL